MSRQVFRAKNKNQKSHIKVYPKDIDERKKLIEFETKSSLCLDRSHTKEAITRDSDFIYNLFSLFRGKYLGYSPKKIGSTMFIFKEDNEIETLLKKFITQTPKEGIKNLVHFIDINSNYSYLSSINDTRFIFHQEVERGEILNEIKETQEDIIKNANLNGFSKSVSRGIDLVLIVDNFEDFKESVLFQEENFEIYKKIQELSKLTSVYPVFLLFSDGAFSINDFYLLSKSMKYSFVLSKDNFYPIIEDTRKFYSPEFSSVKEMRGICIKKGSKQLVGLHDTKYQQSEFGEKLRKNLKEREDFIASFLDRIEVNDEEVRYHK